MIFAWRRHPFLWYLVDGGILFVCCILGYCKYLWYFDADGILTMSPRSLCRSRWSDQEHKLLLWDSVIHLRTHLIIVLVMWNDNDMNDNDVNDDDGVEDEDEDEVEDDTSTHISSSCCWCGMITMAFRKMMSLTTMIISPNHRKVGKGLCNVYESRSMMMVLMLMMMRMIMMMMLMMMVIIMNIMIMMTIMKMTAL